MTHKYGYAQPNDPPNANTTLTISEKKANLALGVS